MNVAADERELTANQVTGTAPMTVTSRPANCRRTHPGGPQQLLHGFAGTHLGRCFQCPIHERDQLAQKLLRTSGLFRICADRSADESIAPITAVTNSLCRSGLAENWLSEFVLGLLLQGLAFFQTVLDVGDDVAHTRIRVITGEQFVDLGDDLVKGHHFRLTDGAGARLLHRFEHNRAVGFQGYCRLFMVGDVVEVDC